MLRIPMSKQSWDQIFQAAEFFSPEYGHVANLIVQKEGTPVCGKPHIAYFHGPPEDTPMRAYMHFNEENNTLVLAKTGLHTGPSEDETVYWEFLKNLFDAYISVEDHVDEDEDDE